MAQYSKSVTTYCQLLRQRKCIRRSTPSLSTIATTKMTFHGFHRGEPAEPVKKKTEQGKVTFKI